MKRALDLLGHFKIPALVCVNKYDLNEQNTSDIIEFCEANNIDVAGNIAFDSVVTEAMVAGKPVIEYAPDCEVSKQIKKLHKNIMEHIADNIS